MAKGVLKGTVLGETIDKLKAKKALREAQKAAKGSGTVTIDTSTKVVGYTPPETKKGDKPTPETKKGDKPTPPPTSDTGTSSGRGSGGKIVSTGRSVTLPQSTLETPTLSAGGLEKPVDVKLNRSGRVTVGSRTYVGNAYISELGMTANQYKNKLRQDLVQRGSIPRGTGYGRFSYITQTGVEEISPGEKIIYDKYGNTSAITSEFFGKTFKTIDEYNTAIDRYNKRIESEGVYLGKQSSLETPTKVITRTTKDKKGNTYTYFADGTYQVKDKKGRVWSGEYDLATGQILYSGGVNPVTPEDVAGLVGGVKAISVGKVLLKPTLKKASVLFSDPISSTASNVVDLILPSKETGFALSGAPRQVGRGGIFYAIGSNPVVSTAFLTSIVKDAVKSPVETVKMIKEYITKNPYELATVTKLGAAELRVRQRIARSKMYFEVVDKLQAQYGKGSKEVLDFQKAWKRGFEELPKRTDIVKKWTSKDLEAINGDVKISKIIDEISSKYKPELIGSTTITPQTTLKELPRGKAGDVDIQNVPGFLKNKSKRMAYELYNKLKSEGYDVRISEGDFFGNPKYHITLKGKELVNIGTDTNYFLKTQLGPIRGLFESQTLGQFTKDPLTGVMLGGIRGQLRVKLAKGYGEGSTARIRQLEKLNREGKLEGREKDIIDALGIVKGTDYLFKNGKYVGPKNKLRLNEAFQSVKRNTVDSVNSNVNKVNDFLTGKKMKKAEYGYYEKIPTIRRRGYSKPSKYNKKGYNPASMLIPTPVVYSKKPEYKPRAIPRPRVVYSKPGTYNPSNYLTNYGRPRVEPPRVTLRPRYPRIRPPRRKKIPETPRPQKLTPREIQKIKKLKEKQLKDGYLTMPTVYDELIGRVGRTTTKKISGFEVSRIA